MIRLCATLASTMTGCAVIISEAARRLRLLALLALAVGTPWTATHAALGVSLSSSNLTPLVGGAAFTYTMTISGDVVAVNDLFATLPLPPGAMLQGIFVGNVTGAFLSCNGGKLATTSTVVCSSKNFPANGIASATVTAKFQPELATGVRTASARVVGDGVAATASVQQNLLNDASLSLSKVAAPTAIAGDALNYLLTVTNNGSSSAFNVSITDVLPATMEFVGVSGSGALDGRCGYLPASRTVQCDVPKLASGTHQAVVTVEAAGNQVAGAVANTATLTAGVGSIVTGSDNDSSTLAHSLLDVDKNGTFDADTDGVMLLRYLFRFKGSSITDNAIGGAAQRATVPLITEYLDYVRPQLDIDGNGSVRPLTDGLLILRYRLGLRGPALITGAVGAGASRSTAIAIESYLGSLLPP